jgi:hypothetical protein
MPQGHRDRAPVERFRPIELPPELVDDGQVVEIGRQRQVVDAERFEWKDPDQRTQVARRANSMSSADRRSFFTVVRPRNGAW